MKSFDGKKPGVPPTKVQTSRNAIRVGDPLDALIKLRTILGDQSVFLLESLAGPDADTKSSVVGITGLLEIAVYRSVVTISGLESLRKSIASELIRARVLRETSAGLRLESEGALWDLPRVIDSCFNFERHADRFDFGLLAFYGYDAVRYIEDLPRTIKDDDVPSPDAIFSLVHGLVTIDIKSGEATLVSAESDLWPRLPEATRIQELLDSTQTDDRAGRTEAADVRQPRSIADDVDKAEYLRRAEVCLDHIRIGDIYQVQLGHEITVDTDANELEVYRRLRWRNPSPYMSLIPIAGQVVIGASPELFVRLDANRTATMRPIAGTVRRTEDASQNELAKHQLLTDKKEVAEHVMLVDLCRNDLGRIAEPMTLQVTDLMSIETYSHMFHIVSNVTAQMAPDRDIHDVIPACFPAGTMTGAPKVRAMEIIESLETRRRGLYAGTFGLVAFGGWSVLGLAIRMTVKAGSRYTIRASAGIVSDSTAEKEWDETLTKMGAAFWAVTGMELS